MVKENLSNHWSELIIEEINKNYPENGKRKPCLLSGKKANKKIKCEKIKENLSNHCK